MVTGRCMTTLLSSNLYLPKKAQANWVVLPPLEACFLPSGTGVYFGSV